MNKITCEICGTVFQDTAACCPICGWTHNAGAGEIPAEDPGLEQEDFDLDALKAEFLSECYLISMSITAIIKMILILIILMKSSGFLNSKLLKSV